MKKTLILFLIVFISFSCGQEKKKIDYLTTFSKAYGYVKYFHPSDEASQINWKQFAVYGAYEINKCKSREDLIETLNFLFKPIAPAVKFVDENNKTDFDFTKIIPEKSEGYCLTYWKHRGVGFEVEESNYSVYESLKTNINCNSNKNQLFEYQPKFEETISENIGSGVFCQIPLVLYRNGSTYPKADKALLKELKDKIWSSSNDPHNLSVRLGNIINTFNVFQHFYPYFDVVDVNWEQELNKALSRSFSDKGGNDHLLTLKKFTAPLKDGHISVIGISNNDYCPQITWEWIEDQLVITNVLNAQIDLKVGDLITHINGKNSKEYFEDIKTKISAATDGWLKHEAELQSLFGPKNSKISVKANGKTIVLIRDKDYYSEQNVSQSKKTDYNILEDSIYYLNLDIISMSKINELLPKLEKCKSIICDLRGYPNSNHEFITHLLKSDDTTRAWMQIPLIVYPNQERIVGYDKSNWIEIMKTKKPYLGDKRVIFIIDGRAISYAESYLGYIEGYHLATIIGQPSAGTNGNVNIFELCGGYRISFTGMKVLKHDGSQHHGIGIIPNVYVTKTIKGVKEGRDEFLEKAIELAEK